MKLDGRVALVTGAGQGIGAAVAAAFAAEGARVAVLGRRGEMVKAVSRDLPDSMPIVCDITDSAAVDDAFTSVVERYGTLDVLANVAGISASMPLWERISTANNRQAQEFRESGHIDTPLHATINISDDEWHEMISTNLTGTFFCTRAALRIMGPRRRGVIINTASSTGVTGWAGIPHYSASKGGVLAFTRAVAREAIVEGIRVNAIAPGPVLTPMLMDKPPGYNPGMNPPLPIGRVADPVELASVYLFLASDDASYMVGETVNVNGGSHTL